MIEAGKKHLIMLALACLIILPGHGQKKYNSNKKYTVEELKEDFIFTKQNLEKYHPGLYWYIEKEEFEAFSDSLYNMITHEMTEFEFYRIILPLFQKVRERHAGVFVSDAGYDWLKNQVKTFPFSLKVIDGKLFVHENGSDDLDLGKGTRIVEINGRSAESIISEFEKKMISDGYNKTAIWRYDIEDRFWYKYYLTIDQKEEFNLLVQKIGEDKQEEVKVSGKVREQFQSRISEVQNDSVAYPLHLEIIDSLNTAVFTLTTFLNAGKNKNEQGLSDFKFTPYVFEQLQSNPHIQNLVIDVRNNGGGNPGAEISMLTYLTEEKPKVYKRVERNKWSLFFKKDSTGKYYSETVLGYTLEPNDNIFKGQVYLLTGGRTYSAASLFSTSLANFTNAVVIGEETGGGYYGTTGGEFKTISTPNVNLDLRIPKVRYMTNVTGQPEGRGLLPDHHVEQTYQDFMRNKDTVMEYTFKLIGGSPRVRLN